MIDVMYGLVLAAGVGGRMGGPKARLVISGVPLVRMHTHRLEEAGCSGVVVVVRAEDADVVPPTAITAISAAPDPMGSLRIGLRRVPEGEERILITPVDTLPVRPQTIGALRAALDREGALAATPMCGDRGGHPVIVRASALRDLARATSLRDVLAALGEERVRVAVDDDRIASDLDEPSDVIARTGSAPVFLSHERT